MNLNITELKNRLCSSLCTDIKIHNEKDGLLLIETPFYFADGDPYQIYIKEMPGGIIRLTDMGHTLMHLSYENDIDKFSEGTRGKIFEQIKSELSIEEDNGELYKNTLIDDIGINILKIGQALTKINDLTFLNRVRAESTFYEDLTEQLLRIVSDDKIQKDYKYEGIEDSDNYPIDFKISGKNAPLFLFGIPNRDKARLTTIILERLLRANADFDSLLIFADQGSIPKSDLARLSNAGGEMIASLDAEEDMSRKINRKILMN